MVGKGVKLLLLYPHTPVPGGEGHIGLLAPNPNGEEGGIGLLPLHSISTSLITQFCYITTFGLVTLAHWEVILMGKNRILIPYGDFTQGTVLPMP